MTSTGRAVVIGAGISGLTAALDLVAAGADVTVLEASPHTGGLLRAATIGGISVDVGAEAMLARRPEGTDLARALGLGDLLVAPTAAKPAVWRQSGARPLPTGTVMGVPGTSTDLSAILEPDELRSTEAAIRAAARRAEGPPAREDSTVADVVARDVGTAVLDLVVEPLLGGVYAGRTDQLSLPATVPALGQAWQQGEPLAAAVDRLGAQGTPGTPVFTGLRGGMAGLARAATERLLEQGAQLRCGVRVTGLQAGHGGWRVLSADGVEVAADVVVLALPASIAARLLGEAVPEAAAELREIATASVAVVALALRNLRPDTSGLLVPPSQASRAGLQVKALTFSSAKWDWVAAQDPEVSLVRASVGRIGEVAALQRPDGDLVDVVRRDIQVLVGHDIDVSQTRVARWGGALPQYTLGHLGRVARIRAAIAATGGIGLAGAAFDGVGVPACIASGHGAAAAVLNGQSGTGRLDP